MTMGAYLNVAAALGLQLRLDDSSAPDPQPTPPHAPAEATIRAGDFPQLRAIAWQLRPETELTGIEALQLYERNWRHVDQATMSDDERAFVQQLADTYSAGVLLV